MQGCFARRHLEFYILKHGEVFRVFHRKPLKHQINRIFIVLVVLAGVACVYHVKQGNKVLFVLSALIENITDKGGIIEFFCLDPEIFGGFFALAFGVRYERGNEL